MKYINAHACLPKPLLEELQRYVQGETIYIPKTAETRKRWGENTDTKQILADRNRNIRADYKNGEKITRLADKYFLSEETIKKIVYRKEA